MVYPSLPLSAAAVNISDGEFSPFYDVVWSLQYEVVDWDSSSDYGLCFFLQDSSEPLLYGGIGIDLGYSGSSVGGGGSVRSTGMDGGLLGIGLDTNGVFAADTTWPGGELRDGLSSVLPNAITLRGGESSAYAYLSVHNTLSAFDLLSDGVKVLRARLGNYGRTIYMDYRDAGDTDFVEILSQDVDLDLYDGMRVTPGVSFVRTLTSQDTDLTIKVHSLHVEGRDNDPDVTTGSIDLITPPENIIPFTGSIANKLSADITAEPPVQNIRMCDPPDLGDISIVKTATPSTIDIGDTVTYTIDVSNQGDYRFTGVLLEDTIPESQRVGTSGDIGLFSGGQTLNGGATKSVTYTLTPQLSDGAVITNTATVTTSIASISGSDSATIIIGDIPGLIINKYETTTGPYEPSQTIGFQIDVSNPNNVPITDVILTDTLSGDNFTLTSDVSGLFGGGVTLQGGASASVTYDYIITETGGIVSNTACVSSILGTSCDTVQTVVGELSALTITKDASTLGPIVSGDTITYTISVTNPNVTSLSAILTDTLSGDNFTLTSDLSSLTTGGTIPGGETAVVTYDYLYLNNSGGFLINDATITYLTDQTSTARERVSAQEIACIHASIIDEANVLINLRPREYADIEPILENEWQTFRAYHPTRPFYLLTDDINNVDSLNRPTSFLSDNNAYTEEVVEDSGGVAQSPDWFDVLKLDTVAPGSTVYFWIDTSGSLNFYGDHNLAYTKFQSDLSTAGITLCTFEGSSNDAVLSAYDEDWLAWHASLTGDCPLT